MSDEDINEWLRIYKENLNDDTVTLEELLFEVNLILPSVALSKTPFYDFINFEPSHDQNFHNIFLESIMNSSCGHRGHVPDSKYLVCKYEELQRMHGYSNPVNCENFPNWKPNQCDECEAKIALTKMAGKKRKMHLDLGFLSLIITSTCIFSKK